MVARTGLWNDPVNVVFTASEIRRYTIDDVIAAHGRRIPTSSDSQREFRAAAVLLVGDDHPAADTKLLEVVSANVAWFSHDAAYESAEHARKNFFGATGGRATITMDGLSQFQKHSPQ